MKSTQGIGVVEVTMGALVVGVLVYLAGQALLNQSRQQSKTETEIIGDTEVAIMLRHLLQVGRLSESCEKIVESTSPKIISLTCKADLGVPSVGTITDVRFRWAQPDVSMRFQTLNGGNWVDSVRYGDKKSPIIDFEICDSAQMSAVNPTCSIEPRALSQVVGKNLIAMQGRAPAEDYTNRVFRFAVRIGDSNRTPVQVIQSSFFVRNPTGVVGISYQWGAMK